MFPLRLDLHIRKKPIQQHTEQHHHSDCQGRPDSDQKLHRFFQNRYIHLYKHTDFIPEYRQQQAGDNHQKKEHRINGSSETQIKIIPGLLALVNTVKP